MPKEGEIPVMEPQVHRPYGYVPPIGSYQDLVEPWYDNPKKHGVIENAFRALIGDRMVNNLATSADIAGRDQEMTLNSAKDIYLPWMELMTPLVFMRSPETTEPPSPGSFSEPVAPPVMPRPEPVMAYQEGG